MSTACNVKYIHDLGIPDVKSILYLSLYCHKCTYNFDIPYGHFHFKLEKKFPQGAKKKYPCTEIIYDFFCHKYSKLHGENVGIDLNLVL